MSVLANLTFSCAKYIAATVTNIIQINKKQFLKFHINFKCVQFSDEAQKFLNSKSPKTRQLSSSVLRPLMLSGANILTIIFIIFH